MTPNQVRLLAWYDQLEAKGLKCGLVTYWTDTLTPLPDHIDLMSLHPNKWDADFEVLNVPDRLGWMHDFLSNNPDFILVLEEGYFLKREAEITLEDFITDEELDDAGTAEGGEHR